MNKRRRLAWVNQFNRSKRVRPMTFGCVQRHSTRNRCGKHTAYAAMQNSDHLCKGRQTMLKFFSFALSSCYVDHKRQGDTCTLFLSFSFTLIASERPIDQDAQPFEGSSAKIKAQ